MNKQLKIYLTMFSFFVLAEAMLGPIYAIFVKNIGGDILAAGSAWAVFMIISGIGVFLMGKFQDKIKNDRKFIIIGYSMRSLGFLGYYFVSNIAQMFTLQIFLGLTAIMITPASYSFYAKHVDSKNLASEWTAWQCVWDTGQGIAALIGSFLAAFYGFKTLFLVMFFVSLISSFIALNLKEELSIKNNNRHGR